MKVLKFGQFVFESYTKQELKLLLNTGLISRQEYSAGMRQTGREEYLNSEDGINTEEIKQILNTDGAKKLMAAGLHHVSSRAQLMNGNIVFSLDPDYHSAQGWGIGFFSEFRAVRRMTPKKVKGLVWRRDEGSMDIVMRKFSDKVSALEFFDTAMAWAADHIDFNIEPDKLKDPKAWKYYVNKRSPRNLS
jgi:hypothetical protein